MTEPLAIAAHHLSFVYPGVKGASIGPVELCLEAGGAMALLGPNGAGKTTLVRLLCGLLAPTGGCVRVLGLDPVAERIALMRRMGVVLGGRTALQSDLPLARSLSLLGALHGLSRQATQDRAADLLERFDILALAPRPPATFSLGQRMRAEMAAAMLHRPAILVLDEPTIGLDVSAKDALRAALADLLREEGISLLLTSHDTQDIARLCPRAVLIDAGKIRQDGTVAEFLARWACTRILTVRFAGAAPANLLPPGASLVSVEGSDVKLLIDPRQRSPAAIVSDVLAAGEVVDLSISEPDLDEALRAAYAGGEGGTL